MSNPVEDAHILVVDDDARLRTLLRRYLTDQGFRVSVAGDAAETRALLRVIAPDLLVLDVMMPGESGLDLIESLRRDSREAAIPVLLLSARGQPEDRIVGFEAGADDYLGKPFEPLELVLRVRAMLRRAVPIPNAAPAPAPADAEGGSLPLGRRCFDRQRGELREASGAVVRLTGGEAALLAALAHQPHAVLSRERIAALLQMDETSERAIDVQVTRLRRKIEEDPRAPRFLYTVRGRGYVLKPGS